MCFSTLEEGALKWKQGVVGYFLDRKLPFLAVKKIAMKSGQDRVKLMSFELSKGSCSSILNLDNDSSFRILKEAGTWNFGGGSMILQHWQACMNFKRNS